MNRLDGARHRAAMLSAAVLILSAAACTSNNEPTTAPTAQADTPTASTSPSPTLETRSALSRGDAEAAAQTAVRDYLVLFNEISNDPDRDVAELENVATDRALTWSTHVITSWREAGQRGVGTQVASAFTVTDVVLDPDTDAEVEHPTVELTACLDVSDADVVDENGNSVIEPDRLDRVLVDYVVINPDWPDDQRWVVSRAHTQLTDSSSPEFVPCD